MILVRATFSILLLVILANGSDKFDLKLLTHDCLENKAIVADYDPLGNMINIGNLSVYEYEAPDNANKKRLLIGVHDIYGLAYPNLKQVTDQMAVQSGGFIAVLPDFFRGEAYDPNMSNDERQEWMDRVGDWNTVIKPDLINLVHHYQSEGVEEFAIFGMCFGGRIATLAAIELSEYFKASGLVHPSSVTDDQAENVLIPMYLMPASNDPDMSLFYQVLQNKFGDNCGHRRFDDMTHGFTGARGNFSDPVNRDRVDEVITKLGVFFDRNLNETKQDTPSSSPKLQSYNFAVTTMLISTVFFVSMFKFQF